MCFMKHIPKCVSSGQLVLTDQNLLGDYNSNVSNNSHPLYTPSHIRPLCWGIYMYFLHIFLTHILFRCLLYFLYQFSIKIRTPGYSSPELQLERIGLFSSQIHVKFFT